MNNIFRKVSIERLSSPEQLDQLIRVTSPKSWMALTAFYGLILTVLFWGIFGSIPERVRGEGILIRAEGAASITSPSSGRISDIRVVSGDLVSKGDVVARIEQPEILNQIREMKQNLDEVMEEKKITRRFSDSETELRSNFLEGQRKNLEETIRVSRVNLNFYSEKITSQEKLLEKGLITRQTLMSTRQHSEELQASISNTENQLRQIAVEQLTLKQNTEKRYTEIEQKIVSMQLELQVLWDRLHEYSRITCPYNGRVIEVKALEGDLVQTGEPVVSVEQSGDEIKSMEAVIYFSASDGKKVRTGMDLQVSPSTVRKEEYGCILGRVTTVAEYPTTFKGMMKVLNNQKLAEKLMGDNVPLEVRGDLILDQYTVSGFRWTSSQGPPARIFSGTMIEASVTTGTRRPVSLVIPMIRKKIGF